MPNNINDGSSPSWDKEYSVGSNLNSSDLEELIDFEEGSDECEEDDYSEEDYE